MPSFTRLILSILLCTGASTTGVLSDVEMDQRISPEWMDNDIPTSTSTAFLHTNEKSHHCEWLHACICRDESVYTNGTYKLMVNCTRSQLDDVPTNIPNITTVLTLDGNNITDIFPGAFRNLILLKYLDISNNNIKTLHNGIFEGLGNLHTLELSGNKIRYDGSIQDEVFKPLTKLVRLNLHQTLKGISPNETYPAPALAGLSHLQQLLIDGLETETFSEVFELMTNLRILELSSDCNRCNLSKINVDMFKTLISVSNLKLSNCNVKTVEQGSFSELKNLTILDLSYNENLHFKNLANITYGLQRHNMRELRLTKIHETFGDCTRLEKQHLLYLKEMRIDDIYMDSNRLAFIKADAVDYIPRKIRKLFLTNNMMLAGDYIHKLFDGTKFKKLEYLTLAEMNLNYDPFQVFSDKTKEMIATNSKAAKIDLGMEEFKAENLYTNETISERQKERINDNDSANITCRNCIGKGLNYDIILYFPPSLHALDLSGLRIRNELRNICICQPNSLIRLNLERNIFWNWQGPITGLSKLLNLNLAWNSCDNLSEDVFDHLPELIELNLTRNFIERFLREDVEGRIFRELGKLQFLLLGDNNIRYIPPKLFRSLKSLRSINLSNNFLTQFDAVFDYTVPLQLLNLEFNLIGKLGKAVMDKFDNVASSKPLFENYYIELIGNNLSCTCNDKDFVKWMSTTKVKFVAIEKYTCKYKNGEEKNLTNASEIYNQLVKDCAQYTLVIILSCSGFVLFLTILITGVIYRYRWDLRYLYYSAKIRMKRNQLLLYQDDDDNDFTFDAFVSYANDYGTFVKDVAISELEDKRHRRILVHDRDFKVGEFVRDNIMEAITISRKTLILMSKKFLKSEWCVFEMNMARMEATKTGRNVICLIMMEEVSIEDLPLEIVEIIKNQTYIEFPTDEAHMEMFWDMVNGALM